MYIKCASLISWLSLYLLYCELNIRLFVMYSSQIIEKDIILSIYQNSRTVFRLNDIAMLTGISNFQSLNKKLNYYVHSGKLLNPRKGIYAKPHYNYEELACSVYPPVYISLEYVLQTSGIVFQYDSRITMVSYLSRNIEVDKQVYSYRRIKEIILINLEGIIRRDNVNIATPERAFLDLLYLDKEYYFDNLNTIDERQVIKLLPLYQSKTLTQRATNLIGSD